MKMMFLQKRCIPAGILLGAALTTAASGTSLLTRVELVNVATANQSTNPYGFPAIRAIDGTTSGNNPDFNHTNNGPDEWLRIELPASEQADMIRIYNRRDCCAERLNGTVVRAFSDAAGTAQVFASAAISGTPSLLNLRFSTTQPVQVVELRQTAQFLHVGEVELYRKTPAVLPLGTNLAQASLAFLSASQSSTLNGNGFPAGLAIDGNTANYSSSAEDLATDQWWKADLGEMMRLEQVEIFNRGDGSFAERLRDIRVEVLDGAGTVVWTSPLLNPQNSLNFPVSLLVDLAAANGGSPLLGQQIKVTRVIDPASTGADATVLSIGEVVITGGSQADGDSDGMPDAYETANGLNPALNDGGLDRDTDGSLNLTEYEKGSNPNVGDTDGDGLLDGVETNTGTWLSLTDRGTNPRSTDTDADSIPDNQENNSRVFVSTTNPGTSPLATDTDGDTILDATETNTGVYVSSANPGTNPNLRDTDSDGFNDNLEIFFSAANPTKGSSRPLRTGLLDVLASWNFNDSSNPAQVTDQVRSYPGLLQNGAIIGAEGSGRSGQASDRALDLGTDAASRKMRALAGFLNIAAIQDEVSFSFWQKLNATTNSTSLWAHSPVSSGEGRGASAHVTYSDGRIYWDTAGCCGGNQRTTTPEPVNVTSGGAIDFAEWRHIVLQKKGTTKEVWIDGTLIRTAVLTGTGTELPRDFTELIVGCNQTTEQVVGLIDDFTVYAEALTPAQIQKLFGTGATDNINPLSIVPPNTDSDGDGLPDAYELANGLSTLVDDTLADPDTDASNNIQEYTRGTNPQNPDTDGDTLKDGAESGTRVYVSASDTGTDPFKPDSDGDGFADNVEVPAQSFVGQAQPGTDPTRTDSDGDKFDDFTEVQVGSNPELDTSKPLLTIGLDLLAYWPFNDASTASVSVDSIYRSRGVMTNGAAYTEDAGGRTGLAGDRALNLGSVQQGQKLLVPMATIVNLGAEQDQITMSFWQKLEAVSPSFSFFVGAADGARLISAHSTWSNNIYYWDTAGCCDGTIHRINGPNNDIDLTTWHHFAFVKNAGLKEVWVDGNLVVSGTNTGVLGTNHQYLEIGSGGLLPESTRGVIDEFAVYADALTSVQIARLAAGESATAIKFPKLEFSGVAYNAAATTVTLTFSSVPGMQYTVQATTDPAAGWPITLTTNLAAAAAGAVTSYTDNLGSRYAPAAPPQRLFYRVVMQ